MRKKNINFICGDCEDYLVCKADYKVDGKYLPKNKKACKEFMDPNVKKITWGKPYWSKYGSHRVYVKSAKRYIRFCNKCGEYITKDTGCSNPCCPEELPECK